MEMPRLDLESQIHPQVLSPSNSGRRRSTDPNSPEFEFWMVRNPSFPTPHLSSADELFNNGILLPLDHLTHQPDLPDSADPNGANNKFTDLETTNTTTESNSEPGPGPESSSGFSASKRWRDIFKIGEKKSVRDSEDCKERNNKEKEKKKDRKSGGLGGGGSISGGAAELNINIWPFSRSHSAGTGTNRPKLGSGSVSRKVSSAPCSRSNSAGESKSRKWPNSPGRGGGIYLGRNSPVWQVRRSGLGLRSSELPAVAVRGGADKGLRKESVKSKSKGGNSGVRDGSDSGVGGTKTRGLNLNVPMCIGYRQQLSCRSDESSFVVGSGGGGGEESGTGGASNMDGGVGGGKLFNLRTLFTRKVY